MAESSRLALILAVLVLSLAAGWVAHLLVGRGEKNWTQLLAVGIAGSFVGGLLASLISGDGLALRPSGLIGSAVGATLVLLVVRAVSKRPARHVAEDPASLPDYFSNVEPLSTWAAGTSFLGLTSAHSCS